MILTSAFWNHFENSYATTSARPSTISFAQEYTLNLNVHKPPYSIYLYIPNRNLNLKTQNWWRMRMEDDSHCTTFDQRRVITVNHRAGKLVQLLNYCSGSSSLNHVVISFCNIVLLLKAGHNTPQQMHQYLIKN